jgi:hypothetical protein
MIEPSSMLVPWYLLVNASATARQNYILCYGKPTEYFSRYKYRYLWSGIFPMRNYAGLSFPIAERLDLAPDGWPDGEIMDQLNI